MYESADGSVADLPPLIGRDAILRWLMATLDESRLATPTLVEIVGDPGVGKTRVLQRFAVSARAHGAQVLSSTGGPLTDSSLFERLGAPAANAGPAGRGPVVIIDDVHCADPASLDLLGRLLRSPPDGLIVAVSYRPRQVNRPMAGALVGAACMHRELVQLRPLTPAQTALLVGLPPGPAAERIYALSGGNPLYAQAYAGSALLAAEAGLDPTVQELPIEVSRVLCLELGRLSRHQKRAVAAAAVLGNSFVPALVPQVAVLDPEYCDRLLDQLVTCDILRADLSTEPLLQFRHPVVRVATYQFLRPRQRRTLHALAAVALRGLGGAPASYAEHVARSAQPGDVNAVHVLLRAGRGGGAPPSTAVRWLSAARWLLPGQDPGDDLGVDIDLALANALISAGRLRESRDVLQHVANRKTMTADQSARTMLARAGVERLLGRPHDAYLLVRSALAQADGRSATTEAMLATEAAVCGALCGSAETEAHGALVAGACDDADPISAVRADIVAAFTASYRGVGAAEAAAALNRAVAAIDALPDDRLGRHLDLLSMLAWAEYLNERDHSALSHFDRGIELIGILGQEPLRPYLLAGRCSVFARQGQLDRARRDGADAEVGAQTLGVTPLATLARALGASVHAWQTGPSGARPFAESTALDSLPRHRDWFAECTLRMAARLRYECEGRVDTSAALLRGCGDTDLSWVEASSRPYWATVLAEIAHTNGRWSDAQWWLDRADRFASALPLRGQAAYVAATRARLAFDTGCPDAGALAETALSAFADLGWLLAEGSARLLRSRILSRARQWRAAEEELAEVRRIAAATGSRRLHEGAVREQRRVSGHAGRAEIAPMEGPLTRREQDIVRLVAEGVSNAEVADRLHITVKTVEAHLTRIFRKFGVSSRAALAATVAVQQVNDDHG